jgi:accessory gene regulator B
MEHLANKISTKIATELSYSQEKRKVIEYGLIAVIQTLFTFTLTLIFGFTLGVFAESALICLAVSLLRKYSGGAHASSMMSCSIVSITACILLALTGRWLASLHSIDTVQIAVGAGIYFPALLIALIRAPVDSPAKPIRTNKKKIRMKKNTLTILVFYITISAFLFFYQDAFYFAVSLYFCLLLSVAWQIGSLTKPGRYVLERYDGIIYRIINQKGGYSHEKN